jgi:beta-galactosidase
VATDNGDSYNLEAFTSHNREAFNGLALVIVRFKAGNSGTITVTAKSPVLKETQAKIKANE